MLQFLTTVEHSARFLSYGDTSEFILKGSKCNNNANGLLFFIKGNCIAVFWTKNNVYVFDSHSRDNAGQPTPDGFSILLKFKNRNDAELYLLSTYIAVNDSNVQYEIQNIFVEREKTETNFARLYYNKKEQARKSTTEAKLKSCQRSSSESQKENA